MPLLKRSPSSLPQLFRRSLLCALGAVLLAAAGFLVSSRSGLAELQSLQPLAAVVRPELDATVKEMGSTLQPLQSGPKQTGLAQAAAAVAHSPRGPAAGAGPTPAPQKLPAKRMAVVAQGPLFAPLLHSTWGGAGLHPSFNFTPAPPGVTFVPFDYAAAGVIRVLSTWESERGSLLAAAYAAAGWDVVFTPQPDVQLRWLACCSATLQRLSSRAGFVRARALGATHVLKTRTDFYYTDMPRFLAVVNYSEFAT